MNNGYPHYRMVELQLPATQNTQTVFAFPDQPDLRYARILAIEVYTVTGITATFPSSYPSIDNTDLTKLSLVLETNDPDDIKGKDTNGRFTSTQQNVKYLPLVALQRVQSAAGAPFVRQLMTFYNMYVTWQKSFVQVVNGGLGNNTDKGIGFGVYYTWLNLAGNPIQRT